MRGGLPVSIRRNHSRVGAAGPVMCEAARATHSAKHSLRRVTGLLTAVLSISFWLASTSSCETLLGGGLSVTLAPEAGQSADNGVDGEASVAGEGGASLRCTDAATRGVCACVPNCEGKSCGAGDGCDGICAVGTCGSGLHCVDGACICDRTSCQGCCAGNV